MLVGGVPLGQGAWGGHEAAGNVCMYMYLYLYVFTRLLVLQCHSVPLRLLYLSTKKTSESCLSD